MDAIDEIRTACHGQDAPISVEEAIRRGCKGRVLINLRPTVELSEIWFQATVSILMSQGRISKTKNRHAWLKGGGEILAVTEREVELGSVRGITPVWIV